MTAGKQFSLGRVAIGPSFVWKPPPCYFHGHVYTGNPKALWAEAVAITGTRIDVVGSDQEMGPLPEAGHKSNRSSRAHGYSRVDRFPHPYVVRRTRARRLQFRDS